MSSKEKSKGTGKIGKKKASLIIQRYARGWLVRHFYVKICKEAKRQKKSAGNLRDDYKKHLIEIMVRHEVDTSCVETNFREMYDYIVKKKCYEEAFDSFTKDHCLSFEKIAPYFDELKLKPTQVEIRLAAEKILQRMIATSYTGLLDFFEKRKALFQKKNQEALANSSVYKEFEYSKQEVLNIAFHIYAPKGTHLTDTRKSTWMCPIVNNDDVLRFELSKKANKKLKLSKCVGIVSTSMTNEKTGFTDETLTPSQQALHDIKQAMIQGPSQEPKVAKKKKKKKK